MTWELMLKAEGGKGNFFEVVQQINHFGMKVKWVGEDAVLRMYTWGSPEPDVMLRTLKPQGEYSTITVVYDEKATLVYENGELTASVDTEGKGKKDLGEEDVWLFPNGSPPLAVAGVRMWPEALSAIEVKLHAADNRTVRQTLP